AVSQGGLQYRVWSIVPRSMDRQTRRRLVLRPIWSPFPHAQKQEFMQKSQDPLATIYGRRLDDFRNEKVEIVGARREPNGDSTVQTKILRGGGSNDIEVDYRLRESNGQWKVIDFIVEEISMVANFRSQFQDI